MSEDWRAIRDAAACRWCRGQGCLVCDPHRKEYQLYHIQLLEAQRKEREALAFLKPFLAKAMGLEDASEVLPNAGMVQLAVAAIEYGKQALRREHVQEQYPESTPAARFSMIEFEPTERETP